MADITEYEQAMLANFPQHDEKGRKNPATMTDRELLMELVSMFRRAEDEAVKMVQSASKNPMLSMIFKK